MTTAIIINSGWLINSIFYTGVLKNNPDVKNIFFRAWLYKLY